MIGRRMILYGLFMKYEIIALSFLWGWIRIILWGWVFISLCWVFFIHWSFLLFITFLATPLLIFRLLCRNISNTFPKFGNKLMIFAKNFFQFHSSLFINFSQSSLHLPPNNSHNLAPVFPFLNRKTANNFHKILNFLPLKLTDTILQIFHKIIKIYAMKLIYTFYRTRCIFVFVCFVLF